MVSTFIVAYDRIICTVNLRTDGYLRKNDEAQVCSILETWGINTDTLRATLNHRRKDKFTEKTTTETVTETRPPPITTPEGPIKNTKKHWWQN